MGKELTEDFLSDTTKKALLQGLGHFLAVVGARCAYSWRNQSSF